MKQEYLTKEYHTLKSREHYQKYKASYNKRNQEQKARTRALVLEAKKDGCRLCDEKEPCCLDFHHLHSKDFDISQMRGMNDIKVKAEIAKCVVLCSNCHRKVHAGVKGLSEEVKT